MSRLTCAQAESMLLEATDGALLPEEQAHFERHLAECPSCTRLAAELGQGAAWMDMLKEAPPVPPADLVNRILAKTSGDPAASAEFLAQAAHAASLFGDSRARVLPFRVHGLPHQPRTRVQRLVYTMTQPRFAMTAAMAFFSIALTLNLAGVRVTALRLGDLRPVNLKKKYWAANSRAVQYYDNLRVVYELESRVHELQRESDDSVPRHGVMSSPPRDEPQRQAPAGAPHSSVPKSRRGRTVWRAQVMQQTADVQGTSSSLSRGKGEQA